MGLQLSRLERTPDKREVGSSSLLKPTKPDAIASGFLFIHSYQFSNSGGRKIRFGYLFVSKTKITTLRYKSTVSSNTKKYRTTVKRIYAAKILLYTQVKRRKRVYWREKLAVYPNPKTKKGILSKKLAVYPNQKTRKGILSEKTRCIPKSKGKKGYTVGKNSLYTQNTT